ncbi:MAG: hypothetical protein ACRCTY_09090 [Candidatus Adiutrix sp.]
MGTALGAYADAPLQGNGADLELSTGMNVWSTSPAENLKLIAQAFFNTFSQKGEKNLFSTSLLLKGGAKYN